MKDINAEKYEKISAARKARNIKFREHSFATHIPSRPAPFPFRFFLLTAVNYWINPPNQYPNDPMIFTEDELGQHFVGEFQVTDSSDLHPSDLHANFGINVYFVLPAGELPARVPGGYTSTPTLFINGQLEATCPGGGLQGRGVASGDLILSQTISQAGLGGDIQIGYASFNVASQHFDLEDTDTSKLLPPMPGTIEMPTVQIPSFAPEDIIVNLEVRIQCYLKSQHASLNSLVQMLIPEWPLSPAT